MYIYVYLLRYIYFLLIYLYIYHLFILVTTEHKAPHFSFFFNSLCACVHSKTACASICKYVFLLHWYVSYLNVTVSDSVCFFCLLACLFVWLLPCSSH